MAPKNPKIFLSYAREDAEIVTFLSDKLKEKGVNIWVDSISLRIGDLFEYKIESAIAESDFALVCLSSKSVSKIGYVQKEFRLILEASKSRPPEIPFALPIKLDPCEAPKDFAKLHWEQLPASNREAFINKLVEAIFEHYRILLVRKNYSSEPITGDRTINVNVTCLPIYAPESEDKLTALLFEKFQLGTFNDQMVKQWVRTYFEANQTGFLENYSARRESLQEHLRKKLIDEFGLRFQVEVTLNGEEFLKPIPVGPIQFQVKLTDSNRAHDLRVETTLLVDNENKVNAILYQNVEQPKNIEGALVQLVKEEIGDYFTNNVSLREFYQEMDDDDFKEGLVKQLNDALKNVGRKIEKIFLRSIPDAPNFFNSQQEVIIVVNDYPERINIKSRVQMILQDRIKYRTADSPNMDIWFKENLVRAIHESFFGINYTDLLFRFQPLERRIKEGLIAEAATIGYDIKQLIIIPDLYPLRWTDYFTIDTEGTFETKLLNAHVKLNIVVTTRIKDLKGIEPYLNRHQDVPKLMEESIFHITRQYLHSVEPERFYMRFYYSDRDGEKPVEAELVNLITDELGIRFHAEVIDVIPKVIDSELIIRLRSLQENICPFQVKITSLHHDETILFSGQFRIAGVAPDGWFKFQIQKYTIEVIKEYLEHYLQDALRAGKENLSYKSTKDLREIDATIDRLATEYLAKEFGLFIVVTSIHRETVHLETNRNALMLKAIESSINMNEVRGTSQRADQIQMQRELLDQLITLLEVQSDIIVHGTDQEIKELDEKITKVKASLLSSLDLRMSTDIQIPLKTTEED